MPIETIIVATCISVAFIGFGLVLAWAERQTSGSHKAIRRRQRQAASLTEVEKPLNAL